jgi:lipid A 4'-phosphatase
MNRCKTFLAATPIIMLMLAGLALAFWPTLDLTISHFFYDPATQSFPFTHHPVARAFFYGVRILAAFFVVLLLTALLLGLRKKSTLFFTSLFLTIAYLIGPGIMVHTVLKDNIGRARPHQTIDFGGNHLFTGAFIPSDHCQQNCSFVSGHASVGFILCALYFATRKRRLLWLNTGIACGLLFGLMRVMQGAHYASDVVWSGLVVLGVSAALWHGGFKRWHARTF